MDLFLSRNSGIQIVFLQHCLEVISRRGQFIEPYYLSELGGLDKSAPTRKKAIAFKKSMKL